MMRVYIDTDNQAFEKDRCEREVARILKEIAYRLEQGERPTTMRDVNGNTVCRIEY